MYTGQPFRAQRRDEAFKSVQRFALATLAATAIVLILATTRADVDLWGHIRFGMDILDSGRVVRVDPYSFTSDVPWINHEWLSEVIFAAGWRTAGNAGLIGVKIASALAALAFLGFSLRARGITGHPLAMTLGVTLAGILPRVVHVRPQLFSVVLFSALLFILERAGRGARFGLIWTVPLMAVWANVHGGWIVGLATVGIWVLGEVWQRRIEGWRTIRIIGYAAAAACATLLNPYGIHLWNFLMGTVQFGREAIAEWGPVWDDPLLLLLWGLSCALLVTAVRRGPSPRNPAGVIIPAIWGLAALRVSRLDAFFVLSVMGLLGPNLSWLFAARSAPKRQPLSMLLRTVMVGGITVLVLAVPAARQAVTCVEVYAPWWPEPEAVQFMRERQLAGRLVTFFRWGEYAIWHLPPSLRVSMDGRRETVYSDATIDGHLRLYEGTDEGLRYLETLSSDYVWLPRVLPITARLHGRGWTPIFQGPESVLFARSDAVARLESGRVLISQVSRSRCFPGP